MLSLLLTALLATSTALVLPREEAAPLADCGILGFTKGAPAYYYSAAATNSFNTCSTGCKSDNACITFGFGGTTCMYLNQTIPNDIYALNTSTYKWYDKSCATA